MTNNKRVTHPNTVKDRIAERGLFDINNEVHNEIENIEWLKSFLKYSSIYNNYNYLRTCVIGTSQSNNKLIAIFCNRIKSYYRSYVNSKQMSEEELKNIIIVMVKNFIFLNKDNLLKTKTHIEQGFYRECLSDFYKNEEKVEQSKEDKELQEAINDLDWGDFFDC